MTILAALALASSHVAYVSNPAFAATKSGSKGCATGYHVVTTSKSAGSTYHVHEVGPGRYGWTFENVKPSAPIRSFQSQKFQNVSYWGITAPVLESGVAQCWPTPGM